MGSLAPGRVADFITDDFESRGIEACNVVWQSKGVTPCACCIVNMLNGSRTVVLADTNLPDVTAEDFKKVELTKYKWIHWEARNASEQVTMIQQVEQYNASASSDQKITISIEIEKPREELYQMFGYGEVVFISKDVAKDFGYETAPAALKGLYSRVKKGAYLICPWAEKGADAVGPDGIILHSDAFSPEVIVDTLGAGDTFNASVICALSRGQSMQEALTFGCQTAGKKCGVQGYDGIV